MTKDDWDAINAWLTAAQAARPLCINVDDFDALILMRTERRDAIGDNLSDQWAVSNGLDVVRIS